MNLLRKYFLLGAIPALIAVGLSTVLDYQITQRLLQEQIDETLEAKLETKSSQVRYFLDEHLALLETFAAMPEVKNGTVPEIMEFLRFQESAMPSRIRGFYFDELDGTVHGTDGMTFNVFDRDYFREVERGEKVITRILKSRGTGQNIILLLVPLRTEEGTLRGAVSLTLLDTQLIDFIRSLEVDRGGFFALVDDSDRMIAATGKADGRCVRHHRHSNPCVVFQRTHTSSTARHPANNSPIRTRRTIGTLFEQESRRIWSSGRVFQYDGGRTGRSTPATGRTPS